ncbi:DUF3750 domain-containing protein [Uliginosibacterium sp. H3]|uniref:DUF3750 domain-containing protein n=1 Tax=Uliginosibacterium silvisoli TaxID=3114758 RepID=A0ABU6K3D6_9RHOO|nr:DUF3750 domain-containing protein [Uliginosibacterium sp. H3]
MKTARRVLRTLALTFVSIGCLSLALSFVRTATGEEASRPMSWADAPRHSSGIAPDPATLADTAIVQVYAAQTWGWRGRFAVHTWIIYKRRSETAWTRYDVVGWRGSDVVQRDYAIADGLWFGAQPQLLVEHRGPGVEAMIGEIEAAIASYPYADTYDAYPGPNSNTFVAHIGREVPTLRLDMPANAIGKDYRPLTRPLGLSPSGRGIQLSLLGLLGFNLGLEEGIELNVLGLDFGIDFNRPALRLPFIGRLGMDDTTRELHD